MNTRNKKQIRISVRNLVEFLLRSGDIDTRGGGAASRDAMLEGARVHRKIQSQRGPDYRAEVALGFEKDCGEFSLVIEGRADGIIPEKSARKGRAPAGICTIEEIKGIYRDLRLLEEPVPVHLAQAKCYAAICARDEKLSRVGVRMTYVQLESGETRFFDSEYDAGEIFEWFEGLVDGYSRWAEVEVRHEKKRNASTEGLEFPFPYRDGQRDIVVAVFQTILQKKQIFAQAPTGVGKTMSTVFPAVRAQGAGNGGKIFYLTAKTIARTVAMEAFSILRESGLAINTVTLTAKEKICLLEEPVCDPEHCPYAKGHYDRVNDALFEMLSEKTDFGREAIIDQCEKHQVCPHEFQLDLTLFSDVIICDYNYVFDPGAKLRRFFGEGGRAGEHIFLIDEAHNLVERGREMFSADLTKEEFLAAKKLLGEGEKKMARALERCNRVFLKYKKECGEACCERENAGELILPLMELAGCMEEFLFDPGHRGKRTEESEERRRRLFELYYRVSAFISIHDHVDEHYLIYCRKDTSGEFLVKLFCVDPADMLQKAMDQARASVLFSATLLPMGYYRSMLSTREDNFGIYIPSPFPAENRLLSVCTDVSSRYSRRGPKEYSRMAAYVHTAVTARPGNYLVFLPSYRMLEAVADIYEMKYAGIGTSILRQKPAMGEREKEEFIDRLGEMKEGVSCVGFCVMGGIFAEGIDLSGERLIGAIVVGTGLPQVGDERELLRAYFDRRGKNGFDYAYRLPGMNKVLQAAGRVIRSDEDRGVILLLDERFANSDYRDLFPREWSDRKNCRLQEMPKRLKEFWGVY